MKQIIYTTFIIIGILHKTALACSCMPKAPTEVAIKESAIVVQGKIIGADTVFRSGSFIIDRKGVRVGRDKLVADTTRYLRIKFAIETRFKSAINMPDTIFVLTHDPQGDACGFPFTPFYPKGTTSDWFYEYIIYAETWYDKDIISITKKGKRLRGKTRSMLSMDTFFTSRCMRTQPTNQEEINKILESIK